MRKSLKATLDETDILISDTHNHDSVKNDDFVVFEDGDILPDNRYGRILYRKRIREKKPQ